jgi:voltage-gated potassium channel
MELSRRLLVALALLAIILLVGTVGYKFLVGGTWLDGLYMTVITLSTVGYGEVVPGLEESPGGRIFTIGLIFFGAGLLLYVISTTTAFFVEGKLTDILRRRKMEREIEKLSDHTIVCGAGTTGIHVIEELTKVGEAFVVIESDPERLKKVLPQTTFLYCQGDATSDEVLLKAGIERARGLVTVLSNDKDNLFVTITARQLNPGARIVARGVEPSIRQRIRQAGADAVVFPNQIGGLRLVSELIRPHVVGFLDRMLRPGREAWRIEEVAVAEGSPSVGKTLGSLEIEKRVGLPVLALTEDEGRKVTYYPTHDTVLPSEARLVVLAERTQVDKLRHLLESG